VNEQPVWAIVVPAELRQTLVRERARLAAQGLDPVEVLDGAGATALVCFMPGSEGTDADVARALAKASDEPIWLLRFGEDLEAAFVYEPDEARRDAGDDPWDVISRSGVPLARPRPELPRSVIAVEGADAEEVRAALGFDPAADRSLHVDDRRTATVVHSEGGTVVSLLRPLAAALPHATLYLLSAGPNDSWFTCRVVRGGADVGEFAPEDVESELDSVKGATDPARIAEALSVPAGLLWP